MNGDDLRSLYASLRAEADRYVPKISWAWVWSPSGFIDRTLGVSCLKDEVRTRTLMHIIASTMPDGAEALDLGAGTGVLGFTAAEAGARSVRMVEEDKCLVAFMRHMAEKLGYARVGHSDTYYKEGKAAIEIVRGDALRYVPDTPFDMVIAELVDTGLIKEPLVPVVDRIRPYASPGCVYYPSAATLSVALLSNDDGMKAFLSRPKAYAVRALDRQDTPTVDALVDVPIDATGTITHAVITTELSFPGEHVTREFPMLCRPYDISVRRKAVSVGDVASLRIKYPYGAPMKDVFVWIEGVTTPSA